MAPDRHYVANHTHGNSSLEGVSREDSIQEVESTKQFSLDQDVHYQRPPHRPADGNTRQYAADLGYAVVSWDIDRQDWWRTGAKVITDHTIRSAYPGAMVRTHDGGGDRTRTIAALETVLGELSAQGYAFRNIFVP